MGKLSFIDFLAEDFFETIIIFSSILISIHLVENKFGENYFFISIIFIILLFSIIFEKSKKRFNNYCVEKGVKK